MQEPIRPVELSNNDAEGFVIVFCLAFFPSMFGAFLLFLSKSHSVQSFGWALLTTGLFMTSMLVCMLMVVFHRYITYVLMVLAHITICLMTDRDFQQSDE